MSTERMWRMRKYVVDRDAVDTANATMKERMAEMQEVLDRGGSAEEFRLAHARYREALNAYMTLVRMTI